jgi:predicted ArsR family transcriptional regulator
MPASETLRSREPRGTKRAVLDHLKRADGATTRELAAAVGVTEAAVRLQLDDLAEKGLVEASTGAPSGRGRPPTVWRLTDVAHDLFPDRHADLSVELLANIRAALGEEGLERVIEERTRRQQRAYEEAIESDAPLERRIRALARRRTDEGYMAEARRDDDGWLLIEHHCPICDAATECQGLCRGELTLFRTVLGEDVSVEREQHLLAGDARCVYRVRATD